MLHNLSEVALKVICLTFRGTSLAVVKIQMVSDISE